MKVQLAFYRGPATKPWDRFRHWCVRAWTNSKWSHVELVIDGICHSSSPRDGGVRAKVIDLRSGKWDVIDIQADTARALQWFKDHDGQDYDWAGIARFVLPLLPHNDDQWFCFESVSAALGLENPHKMTANKLYDHYFPEKVKAPAFDFWDQ